MLTPHICECEAGPTDCQHSATAKIGLFERYTVVTTIPFSDGNQSRSTVHALVVDDFQSFRRFVCSMLGRIPGLQIIGEASDGLEAVQKSA
jgi:hypothetical protein